MRTLRRAMSIIDIRRQHTSMNGVAGTNRFCPDSALGKGVFFAPFPTSCRSLDMRRTLILTLISLPFICLLSCLGKSANNALMKYTNTDHKYEIRYPEGWTANEEATICDEEQPSFCVQETTLRGPDRSEVYVFVNFQGGFCETTRNLEMDINVSGKMGREYVCPGFTIKSFGEGSSILRFFPEVNEKNYLVLGQTKGDLALVRTIVESFRFLE